MEEESVLRKLSHLPVALGRKLALLSLRLARLTAIAAIVAALLIILDAVFLSDDDEREAPEL
jgi:hypothetical protein